MNKFNFNFELFFDFSYEDLDKEDQINFNNSINKIDYAVWKNILLFLINSYSNLNTNLQGLVFDITSNSIVCVNSPSYQGSYTSYISTIYVNNSNLIQTQSLSNIPSYYTTTPYSFSNINTLDRYHNIYITTLNSNTENIYNYSGNTISIPVGLYPYPTSNISFSRYNNTCNIITWIQTQNTVLYKINNYFTSLAGIFIPITNYLLIQPYNITSYNILNNKSAIITYNAYTPLTTNVSTFAGSTYYGPSLFDGSATKAGFNLPNGIAYDGSNYYVADTYNHAIRKVTQDGTVSTIAGTPNTIGYKDDYGYNAKFNTPTGIIYTNGQLIVSDTINSILRSVKIFNILNFNTLTLYTGSNNGAYSFIESQQIINPNNLASNLICISVPQGITLTKLGDIYTLQAPQGNTNSYQVSLQLATTSYPYYTSIQNFNINTTLLTKYYSLQDLLIAGDNINNNNGSTGDGGLAINARLQSAVTYFTIDNNNNIYIIDKTNVYNYAIYIRKIDSSTGIINRFAGVDRSITPSIGYSGDGGLAINAKFQYMYDSIYLDSVGNLYIADIMNGRLRKVNISTNIISTVAGNGTLGGGYSGEGDGGLAINALVNVYKICIDKNDNIYILSESDPSGYHVIRKVIKTTGIINTIYYSGDYSYTLQNVPCFDVDTNNNLYFIEFYKNTITKLNMTTNTFSQIATITGLLYPLILKVDRYNNVYCIDTYRKLYKIDTLGNISIIKYNVDNFAFGKNNELYIFRKTSIFKNSDIELLGNINCINENNNDLYITNNVININTNTFKGSYNIKFRLENANNYPITWNYSLSNELSIYASNNSIFETISKLNPDTYIWLGDAAYVDVRIIPPFFYISNVSFLKSSVVIMNY